jgi:hypothetical protein
MEGRESRKRDLMKIPKVEKLQVPHRQEAVRSSETLIRVNA